MIRKNSHKERKISSRRKTLNLFCHDNFLCNLSQFCELFTNFLKINKIRKRSLYKSDNLKMNNRPTTHVNQVFKAIGTDQLNGMRERFFRQYIESQTDDYYYRSYNAKKSGQKTFATSKKITNVKDVLRYSSFDDSPGLGHVRLRHSSTSQPLVDSEVDYIAFEKNPMMLEQLWSFLLKLEDLLREDNQNSSKITSLIRFIVHSLQFNTTSDANSPVDPSSHQRFFYFLNDPKGQNFLVRFLDIMPTSFLKRFFFTSFIVFKDVKIDPTSKFAVAFLQRLTNYLEKDSPKPKWLCAFINQAMSAGFANIVSDRFRLACLASLLLTARYSQDGLSEGDRIVFNSTLKNTADLIIKDLGSAIQKAYNPYFMHSIFKNILILQPECELRTLISATSV
ncbi:hypothetical protein TRFO_29985 [Tritrichomonas foetus]|uniref:Uncharacterized protein n=1 Tax=Tritrichomonas foetus TaxID=1144522 RepID=A0A1J4JZ27_9EUKA|nr:hypothetical protein TRFO_29985 [Tritrichomonas foetus]|eukprot:OHT02788.1 hypothetical protein TRFO_29985 [Tritrichomonas foetus]